MQDKQAVITYKEAIEKIARQSYSNYTSGICSSPYMDAPNWIAYVYGLDQMTTKKDLADTINSLHFGPSN